MQILRMINQRCVFARRLILMNQMPPCSSGLTDLAYLRGSGCGVISSRVRELRLVRVDHYLTERRARRRRDEREDEGLPVSNRFSTPCSAPRILRNIPSPYFHPVKGAKSMSIKRRRVSWSSGGFCRSDRLLGSG